MNPEAEVTLALMLAQGVGSITVNQVLSWAKGGGHRLEELASLPQRELIGRLPAGLERAAGALARCRKSGLDRARRLLGRVERAGGQVLPSGDEDYPESLRAGLGREAPPLLFVLGDAACLSLACAGIVGTRRPSRAGARLSEACAGAFACENVPVVSGGAAGVDLTAHGAALASGGRTIVVLPQGLLSYRGPESIMSSIEEGAAALVSEFVPDAPWSAHAAVQRNATIAGLSRLVCVIEPRKTGGSIRTGRCALAQGKRVLVDGGRDRPAEKMMLEEGARRLLDRTGSFSRKRLRLAWAEAPSPGVKQAELF